MGGYSAITLTIDFADEDNIEKLTKDGSTIYFFTELEYEQAVSKGNALSNLFSDIIARAGDIEDTFGDASSATRVAKAIDEIFYFDGASTNLNRLTKAGEGYKASYYNSINEPEPQDLDSNLEKIMLKAAMNKYNTCVSSSKKEHESSLFNKSNQSSLDSDCLYYQALQYYEYMQFKTMEFECTKLTYDETTGRVETMEFKCKGSFAK